MNSSELKKIGAIAAGVLVIGGGVMLATNNRNNNDDAGRVVATNSSPQQSGVSGSGGVVAGPETAEEAVPSPTIGTTTSTSGVVVPVERDTVVENVDEDFDPSPTGDERFDSEELVRAWGCGWWARPTPGETVGQLAERLGPITGQTLYDSILDLNGPPDVSGNTIDVVPGVVEYIGSVDIDLGSSSHYRVWCNIVELDSDKKPVGAPRSEETDVWVKTEATPENGLYVAQAKVGGLVIP